MDQVFISHAAEDANTVARPLAVALRARGYDVWIDADMLIPGDGLRRQLEQALAGCRHAAVILSPAFFESEWAQRELDGLVARETVEGSKLVIPILHQMDAGTVARIAPMLADRLGIATIIGIDAIASTIAKVAIATGERMAASLQAQRVASRGGPTGARFVAAEQPPSSNAAVRRIFGVYEGRSWPCKQTPGGLKPVPGSNHLERFTVADTAGQVTIAGMSVDPATDETISRWGGALWKVAEDGTLHFGLELTVRGRREYGTCLVAPARGGVEGQYYSGLPNTRHVFGFTAARVG